MLDYRPELLTKLSSLGLPVECEFFLTKDVEIPCISYLLLNDINTHQGDTMVYSDQYYKVTIWANKLSTLAEYSEKVDNVMRELGFKRTGSNELWLDGIGQLAITYKGLAKEEI